MHLDQSALRALADLLEYPDVGYRERVAEASRLLARAELPDPLQSAAEALCDWAAGVEVQEAQELYTRTFDLSPAATLDVGWHVFGESYKRGALLVGLRGALRDHGVDSGAELPDHLPVVLRLMATMPDGEDRELLRRGIVGPALRAMAVTFRSSETRLDITAGSERTESPTTAKRHPFAPVLIAAAGWLASDVRRATHLPVLRSPSELMEGNHA